MTVGAICSWIPLFTRFIFLCIICAFHKLFKQKKDYFFDGCFVDARLCCSEKPLPFLFVTFIPCFSVKTRCGKSDLSFCYMLVLLYWDMLFGFCIVFQFRKNNWNVLFLVGQHNDARMNLAIGLTAARQGACLANHTEVLKLLKQKDPKTGKEKLCGATVKDKETGNFTIQKVKVNQLPLSKWKAFAIFVLTGHLFIANVVTSGTLEITI